MRKLLVLGIDAATWDVIDEGIEQGKMPFFEKLKNEGCYSDLESTNPPRTCPAWPAFMTGKNPGKMGMYGFSTFDYDYGGTLNSYDKVDADPFWDILNRKGYTCGVLNVPVTWPPEIEDGFMVSGLLTPSSGPGDEERFAVPKRLQEKLENSEFLLEPNIDEYSEEEFREMAENLLESRANTTLELAEEEDWNVLTSVIRITDPFKHKFWRKGNKQEVVDFYEKVDEEIKSIIKGIQDQEKTNVLIVSDHGFGRIDGRLLHFNTWLQNKDYLKFEESRTNYWMDKLPLDEIYNLISKLGIKNVRKYAPKKVLQARSAFNMDIKWGETTAICDFVEDTGLIYINQQERFEEGTVSEEDYKEIREEIAEGLKKIEDPRTNEKVISELCFREDVYSGKYLDQAPDILVKMKEGYRGRNNTGNLFSDMAEERQYAVHTPEGILLAFGPDIKKGVEIEKRSIYDIAPTILHMMGVRVPKDIDGEVLTQMFRDNSKISKEVNYIGSSEEILGLDL